MKSITIITIVVFGLLIKPNNDEGSITKKDIESDLIYLDNFIQKNSSYQGLNGYDYKREFDEYEPSSISDKVSKVEFGKFLTMSIGKMGDRHSYIGRYRLPNSKFFPMAFAPVGGKVIILQKDTTSGQYKIWNSDYPFLKAIQNLTIDDLLPQILPEEIKAPEKAYFTRAVRELRDIEKIYAVLNKELPDQIPLTLTNDKGEEKLVKVSLVERKNRLNRWDEQFYRKHFFRKGEEFNNPEVYNQLFSIDDNVSYIQIPNMVDSDEAPEMYKAINLFMHEKAINTGALIVDVRSNKGGVRGLIKELAGYFVHPDSIYIVNVTRQRGDLPLNEELKDDLHSRFLFSFDELDKEEQLATNQFNRTFKPMYKLDDSNFSERHYCVLNGSKLSKDRYHYNKPIYILANERSFSAAAVLVAIFKGLPNVKIAGITTDGSSGNSKRFELPNSKLSGRISTMVSFQKDGRVLDGFGTDPDIVIERNLDQVLWKTDYQLDQLKGIINTAPNKGLK